MKPSHHLSPKVINAVAGRFIELNVPDHALYPVEVGLLANGDAMLVVQETEEICPCCKKPVINYWLVKPSKTPLRKLFKR